MSSPISGRSNNRQWPARGVDDAHGAAAMAGPIAGALLAAAIWGVSGSVGVAQEQAGALRAVPPAAAEGGPRRWSVTSPEGLTLRAAPGTDARVIGDIAAGAVLSNLGCMWDGGQVWCAVRVLPGGMRGVVPADRLRPARGPDGTSPVGVNDSPRRARTRDFDATAEVGCAQEAGEAIGSCSAGVARAGGGDATVVVTFPTGFSRMLYFVNGDFVSANATMSGVGTDTESRIEGETHLLQVDDQRYVLPAEFVFGE